MSDSGGGRGDVLVRVVLIAAATVSVGSLFVLSERLPGRVRVSPPEPQSFIATPVRPIAAEANVFRTQQGVLALPVEGERTRDAHPRTLASVRNARAFPGAPPRIPHGFTADEFRTGFCTTCHERGGYAPRFGAYVPVTPHPEWTACLQCHVGNDEVIGVRLPSNDPSTRCRQCHLPAGGKVADISSDWRPLAFPAVARGADQGEPPRIPHDLMTRTNCVACHAGPSAVAEIRTTHPERANCRQCHLAADADASAYVRPPAGSRSRGEP